MAEDKISHDRTRDKELGDNPLSMPELDNVEIEMPGMFGGVNEGQGRKPSNPTKEVFVAGLKGVGKGVLSGTKEQIYHNIPSLEAINSEISDGFTEFKEMKDELSRQLGPMVVSLEQSTRRVLPRVKRLMPKGIYEKIQKKLDDREAERKASTYTPQTKEQMENETITSELAAIFEAQQESARADAFEAKKTELTSMALDSARHKKSTTQLTHIYDSMRATELFHRTIHTAYLRKSLELKYKHLFVARDTFNLLARSMGTFEGYMKAITRNTGLPDMMKIQIGDYHRKNVTEKYGKMMADFKGNIRKHIFEKVKEKAKTAVQGLGMFADQISMASSMAEMQGDESMGGDPNAMPKGLAGFIGKGLAHMGAGAAARKYLGKLKPYTDNIEDTLKNARGNAFLHAANLRRKWGQSDSRILKMLSDFLPELTPLSEGGNDLLTKPNDAAVFDNMTRQSIVEIIPGYLAKIFNSLEKSRTGDENIDETVYNVYSRKFTTSDQLKKDVSDRLYGSEETRRAQFTKALGTLQAGVSRNDKEADPKNFYKGLEKDINRVLVNHAVFAEFLDLDAMRSFIATKDDPNAQVGSYMSKIITGLDHDPVQVIQAILHGVITKEGGYDRRIVTDINNVINEYRNIDSYRAEMPRLFETYGYRDLFSDKISTTEKNDLMAKAAKGGEEGRAAAETLRKAMGLVGDKNEINMREVARMQAGVKFDQAESAADYAREEAINRYAAFDKTDAEMKEWLERTGIAGVGRKAKGKIKDIKDYVVGEGTEKVTEWAKEFQQQAGDKVLSAAEMLGKIFTDPEERSKLGDKITSLAKDGFDATRRYGATALNEVRGAINDPKAAYAKATEMIGAQGKRALDAFNKSEMGNKFTASISEITEMTKKAKESAESSYNMFVPDSVKRVLGEVADLARKAPKEAAGLLDKVVAAYEDHVPTELQEQINEIRKTVQKTVEEKKAEAVRIITQLANEPEYRAAKAREAKKAAEDAIETAGRTVKSGASEVREAAGRIGAKAAEMGRNTVERIRSVVDINISDETKKQLADTIRDAFADALKDAVAGLKNAESEGPSEGEQHFAVGGAGEFSTSPKQLTDASGRPVGISEPGNPEVVTPIINRPGNLVNRLGRKISSILGGKKVGPVGTKPSGTASSARADQPEAEPMINMLSYQIADAMNEQAAKFSARATTATGGAMPPPNVPPTDFSKGPADEGKSTNDLLEKYIKLYTETTEAQRKAFEEWRKESHTDLDAIFASTNYISKVLHDMPPAIASGQAMPYPAGADVGRWGTAGARIGKMFKGAGRGAWSLVKNVGKVYTRIYSAALKGAGTALGGIGQGIGKIGAALGGVAKGFVGNPDYVDIYRKDTSELLVSAKQQKKPGVFYKSSGKRVLKSKDIKEPVVDADGNYLITEDDLKAGLSMPNGSPLNGLFKMGAALIGGYFNFYGALAKTAGNVISTVTKSLFGTKGEPYVDIYRKDEIGGDYKPILTAARQERDPGVFFKNGKRVRNSEDITEPVYAPNGKEIITQDDIDHGIVGANNKPIATKAGRAGLISKALDMGKAIMPFIGKIAKGGFDLYAYVYKKLFGVAIDGIKGVGKGVGALANRLFGFNVAGASKELTENTKLMVEFMKSTNEAVLQIRDDVDLIARRKKKGGKAGDKDDDGDIDGTYEDQMEKKRQEEEERAAAAAARSARMGAGGAGGMGGGDIDADFGDDDEGGFLQDMLEWEATKWIGRKAKNGYNRAKKWGKSKTRGKGGWKWARKTRTGTYLAKKRGGAAMRKGGAKALRWLSKGGKWGKLAAGVAGTAGAAGGASWLGGLFGGGGGAAAATTGAATTGAAATGAVAAEGAAATGTAVKAVNAAKGAKTAAAGAKVLTGGGKAASGMAKGGAAAVKGGAKGIPGVGLALMGVEAVMGGAEAYDAYKSGDTAKGNIKTAETVGSVGGGALGAWGGAAAGAAIGSVIPGIGTAIGGVIGGAIGAIAGAATGEGLLGGVVKAIQGDDNPMTPEEIEKGHKILERKVAQHLPGYDRILQEYEKAVEAKNWARARQLCGVKVDGLVKSLWETSKWATLGGTWLLEKTFKATFGDKNEPMTKEQIEKVHKKFESLMKKGGSTAKNAEMLLSKFDDYVVAEDWAKARQIAGMENRGLFGAMFQDSKGNVNWAQVIGTAAFGLAGWILTDKADPNKPMSESEVKDAIARLEKLKASGNKRAEKVLEEFQEAVTEMNWKKARKLVGEETMSALGKIGYGAKKTFKFLGSIINIGDDETPMSQSEIDKFTKKMRYLSEKKGDKNAQRKLERFEDYVVKGDWSRARDIAHMPHKGWVTRSAKAIGAWFVGDDDKEMTEQEIQKFRDSMERKIKMGHKGAQKKLDAFEDAIGRQNWVKARRIADKPDEGILQKTGHALVSAGRFFFGGDGKPMDEGELKKARMILQNAVEDKKRNAQKRLDLFEDYVADEKWDKARKLVNMPYDNIVSRAAKGLKNWLVGGDNTEEMTAEEIDNFRSECEARIADGNKHAEKLLNQFNAAVAAENWIKARKLSNTKNEGMWGSTKKAAKSVWNWITGNSDRKDCEEMREKIEDKALDDSTGVINAGLDEFTNLVRRRKFNEAMKLGKDILKYKPDELVKKRGLGTAQYKELAKKAETLAEKINKAQDENNGWTHPIKEFQLGKLRRQLMNNSDQWSEEFFDEVQDELGMITEDPSLMSEGSRPDQETLDKGNKLLATIDAQKAKRSWFGSPIVKYRLGSLRNEVANNVMDWDDGMFETWEEQLAEIDDEYVKPDNPDDLNDPTVKSANTLLKDLAKTKDKFSWISSPIIKYRLGNLNEEIQSGMADWSTDKIAEWRKRLSEIAGEDAVDSREAGDQKVIDGANTLLSDIDATTDKFSWLSSPIVKTRLKLLKSKVRAGTSEWSTAKLDTWRKELVNLAGKDAVDTRSQDEADMDAEEAAAIEKRYNTYLENNRKVANEYSWIASPIVKSKLAYQYLRAKFFGSEADEPTYKKWYDELKKTDVDNEFERLGLDEMVSVDDIKQIIPLRNELQRWREDIKKEINAFDVGGDAAKEEERAKLIKLIEAWWESWNKYDLVNKNKREKILSTKADLQKLANEFLGIKEEEEQDTLKAADEAYVKDLENGTAEKPDFIPNPTGKDLTAGPNGLPPRKMKKRKDLQDFPDNVIDFYGVTRCRNEQWLKYVTKPGDPEEEAAAKLRWESEGNKAKDDTPKAGTGKKLSRAERRKQQAEAARAAATAKKDKDNAPKTADGTANPDGTAPDGTAADATAKKDEGWETDKYGVKSRVSIGEDGETVKSEKDYTGVLDKSPELKEKVNKLSAGIDERASMSMAAANQFKDQAYSSKINALDQVYQAKIAACAPAPGDTDEIRERKAIAEKKFRDEYTTKKNAVAKQVMDEYNARVAKIKENADAKKAELVMNATEKHVERAKLEDDKKVARSKAITDAGLKDDAEYDEKMKRLKALDQKEFEARFDGGELSDEEKKEREELRNLKKSIADATDDKAIKAVTDARLKAEEEQYSARVAKAKEDYKASPAAANAAAKSEEAKPKLTEREELAMIKKKLADQNMTADDALRAKELGVNTINDPDDWVKADKKLAEKEAASKPAPTAGKDKADAQANGEPTYKDKMKRLKELNQKEFEGRFDGGKLTKEEEAERADLAKLKADVDSGKSTANGAATPASAAGKPRNLGTLASGHTWHAPNLANYKTTVEDYIKSAGGDEKIKTMTYAEFHRNLRKFAEKNAPGGDDKAELFMKQVADEGAVYYRGLFGLSKDDEMQVKDGQLIGKDGEPVKLASEEIKAEDVTVTSTAASAAKELKALRSKSRKGKLTEDEIKRANELGVDFIDDDDDWNDAIKTQSEKAKAEKVKAAAGIDPNAKTKSATGTLVGGDVVKGKEPTFADEHPVLASVGKALGVIPDTPAEGGEGKSGLDVGAQADAAEAIMASGPSSTPDSSGKDDSSSSLDPEIAKTFEVLIPEVLECLTDEGMKAAYDGYKKGSRIGYLRIGGSLEQILTDCNYAIAKELCWTPENNSTVSSTGFKATRKGGKITEKMVEASLIKMFSSGVGWDGAGSIGYGSHMASNAQEHFGTIAAQYIMDNCTELSDELNKIYVRMYGDSSLGSMADEKYKKFSGGKSVKEGAAEDKTSWNKDFVEDDAKWKAERDAADAEYKKVSDEFEEKYKAEKADYDSREREMYKSVGYDPAEDDDFQGPTKEQQAKIDAWHKENKKPTRDGEPKRKQLRARPVLEDYEAREAKKNGDKTTSPTKSVKKNVPVVGKSVTEPEKASASVPSATAPSTDKAQPKSTGDESKPAASPTSSTAEAIAPAKPAAAIIVPDAKKDVPISRSVISDAESGYNFYKGTDNASESESTDPTTGSTTRVRKFSGRKIADQWFDGESLTEKQYGLIKAFKGTSMDTSANDPTVEAAYNKAVNGEFRPYTEEEQAQIEKENAKRAEAEARRKQHEEDMKDPVKKAAWEAKMKKFGISADDDAFASGGYAKKFSIGGMLRDVGNAAINMFTGKGFSGGEDTFLTKPTTSVDGDGNSILAGEANTEAIIPLTKRPGNLLMRIGNKLRDILTGKGIFGPSSIDTTAGTKEASVHASDPDSEPMTNFLARQLSDVIGLSGRFDGLGTGMDITPGDAAESYGTMAFADGGVVKTSSAATTTSANDAETIAANLIAKYEGFRSKKYKCPAGVETIGYGFTDSSSLKQSPMSKDTAWKILKKKVASIITKVEGKVKNLNNKQKAALCSFIYNLGEGNFNSSTMLKRLKEGKIEEACKELKRWNKAGGKVLAGLTKRREEEATLLASGIVKKSDSKKMAEGGFTGLESDGDVAKIDVPTAEIEDLKQAQEFAKRSLDAEISPETSESSDLEPTGLKTMDESSKSYEDFSNKVSAISSNIASDSSDLFNRPKSQEAETDWSSPVMAAKIASTDPSKGSRDTMVANQEAQSVKTDELVAAVNKLVELFGAAFAGGTMRVAGMDALTEVCAAAANNPGGNTTIIQNMTGGGERDAYNAQSGLDLRKTQQ